jgi:prefoldin subunit 2
MSAPAEGIQVPTETMADLKKAQQVRNQAQQLGARLAELRLEVAEHDRVIQVLKGVGGDRTCFRLMGEVLVERQVGQVLPELETTRAQLLKTIEAGAEQKTGLDKEAQALMAPHGEVLEQLGRQEVQRGAA